MDAGTIKVSNSINKQPFIVDACDTDHTKKTLSTKDWMLEEISNIGMEDVLYDEMEDGVYSVSSTGSYDHYSGDSDYELHFIKVD